MSSSFTSLVKRIAVHTTSKNILWLVNVCQFVCAFRHYHVIASKRRVLYHGSRCLFNSGILERPNAFCCDSISKYNIDYLIWKMIPHAIAVVGMPGIVSLVNIAAFIAIIFVFALLGFCLVGF